MNTERRKWKQRFHPQYQYLSHKEQRRYYLLYLFLLAALLWLCFRSLLVCLSAFFFIPALMRRKDREKGKQKELLLQQQFRKVMEMMYSSAAAGSTAEKCITDALQDMRARPEEYTELLPAFEDIARKLSQNVPFTEAMEEFAAHSLSADVRNFVRILCSAVRSGGSLPEIIKRMSDAVSMRVEVNEDIDTLLTEKKSELRLMKIFPLGIFVYLCLVSADYMTVLFDSAVGHMIMAGVLGVYVLAVYMAEKILDIRV